MPKKKKLIFVGIDSADYFQIKRLAGFMPNVSRLKQLRKLTSTVPPHTAASWTSMLTGTNPGKHGIYYFKDIRSGRVLSSRDVSSPYVWDLLSETGLKAVVVNVPLTHPISKKIDGVMISGMHASKADDTSVYPKTLIAKVKENYRFDLEGLNLPFEFSKDRTSAYEKLISAERMRVSFFCELLKQVQWDFACIVLTALDRVQHYFWGLDPKLDPIGRYVRSAYIEMDSLLGQIVNTTGDDCNLVVASDHGFEEKKGAINVNRILMESGLLKPLESVDSFENRIVRIGSTIIEHSPKILGRFLYRLALKLFPNILSHQFDLPPIDYSKTKAYCYSYGLVSVNLLGRNPNGVVEQVDKEKEVETVMKALANGASSPSSIILRPVRSSNRYHGQSLDRAPDILLEPVAGYYFSCHIGKTVIDNQVPGEHSTDGFLGVSLQQDSLKSEQLKEPKVWDVGASLLSLLGYRRPDLFDGESLLVKSSNLRNLPVAQSAPPESLGLAYSKDEEAEIVQRLKDMGYE